MIRALTLSVMLVAAGGLFAADPPKPKVDAAKKAKREARLKAQADAKAKEEAAAKVNAEAETKARSEAAAKEKDLAAARAKSAAERKAKNPPDHRSLTKKIDIAIYQKLVDEKIPASPRADDDEFLRRVYLDLIGVVPPADKAEAFLDNKDAQKRAKLIDELLDSQNFGRHMADIWDNLLFQRVTDNRAIQREPLTTWLQDKFNADISWDSMVTQLLTANGSQEDNGATTYFLASLTADKMVDSATRLFMGVKMECAQCHNHPFTGWKQNEYWGMAAFFMNVRIQGNTKNNKNGGMPEVMETSRGKQKNLPESAKNVPAKFFQGTEPKIGGAESRRPLFAKWLATPENKFFSRAFANRVWGQLFGAGIVNPIDDMHEERTPSHPELLAELAKQFATSGFDVKFLFRALCNSEAYQRTSRPIAGNEQDATLFSHMYVKSFTPEQLYDSLTTVLGPVAGNNKERMKDNTKRGPVTVRDQFVAFFDPGEGTKITDYDAGIPQALRLMNHPFTATKSVAVARAVTRGLPVESALEKLYLATLSRRPTAEEVSKRLAYIGKCTTPEEAYGDILWALVNCSEFTLNH